MLMSEDLNVQFEQLCVQTPKCRQRFCLGAENGVPCSKKRSASDAAFSEVFSRIVHVQNRVRNQGTTLCKAVQSGVGS